jgi:hypothetical protein
LYFFYGFLNTVQHAFFFAKLPSYLFDLNNNFAIRKATFG